VKENTMTDRTLQRNSKLSVRLRDDEFAAVAIAAQIERQRVSEFVRRTVIARSRDVAARATAALAMNP